MHGYWQRYLFVRVSPLFRWVWNQHLAVGISVTDESCVKWLQERWWRRQWRWCVCVCVWNHPLAVGKGVTDESPWIGSLSDLSARPLLDRVALCSVGPPSAGSVRWRESSSSSDGRSNHRRRRRTLINNAHILTSRVHASDTADNLFEQVECK